MLYLVTGNVGSGKTLSIVKQLPKFCKQYDLVFHNIEGLNRYFFWSREASRKLKTLDFNFSQASELIEFLLAESRKKVKTARLFIIDEAPFYFANSRKKFEEPEFINFLAYSRHYNIDILFIAQNAAMLHYQIRHLINHHTHIRRKYGTGLLTILKKEGVIYETVQPFILKKQVESGDIILERDFLDRRFFDAYQSTQAARIKKDKQQVPLKLKLTLLFLAILPFVILLPLYRFMK